MNRAINTNTNFIALKYYCFFFFVLDTELSVRTRWSSFPNHLAENQITLVNMNVADILQCLQLCEEALVEPNCTAVDFNSMDNMCTFLNEFSNVTSYTDRHYFELIKGKPRLS